MLKLKHEKEIDIGYFIFITNDYLYWQKSKSGKNNSNEYSFEQGKKIKTQFPKPDWSSRTYQHNIDLREITTKNIMWRGHDYGKKRNSFRFFIVEI